MKRLLSGSVWRGAGVLALAVACALMMPVRSVSAQGVTTSSIAGIVKDGQGLAVPGATVTAVHEPSGTTYEAYTQADGRFAIQGMRVGGPYTVKADLAGFQPQATKDVYLSLGVGSDISLTLGTVALAETVTVSGKADPIFSSERTGAGTAVTREAIMTMPTISNRLESFVKLTPQAGANMSFGGVDNRLNNITVDGSSFNNSFGLGGSPGDRTGVAPISMAAVEAVQVNIAPYDVRQGNFVGAGVNTVTRSGTNSISGSLYYQFRDESLVGTKAKNLTYNPGTFDYKNLGVWLGGPIIKNKLFFFGSFEDESLTQPGTTWQANPGGAPVVGNMTRVLASDLDELSSFLKSKFGYDTGAYQGYNFQTPAKRYLAKIDWNVSQRNKLSLRYTHLDSVTDVLASNSTVVSGNRRNVSTALNFANNNYQILEDIRSFIGELNSTIGNTMSNTLIAGYTYQDESRSVAGGPTTKDKWFPAVDIMKDGLTYTSFGFEMFTPNNQLRYKTFQAQDNFSWYRNKHTLTGGVSVEKYHSDNVFYPQAQSVYTYSSLADFYADANGHLANPSRTTSPVALRRFIVGYVNIPGMDEPLQPLDVWTTGAYVQDVWQASNNLKVTLGIRADRTSFGATGYPNAEVAGRTFRDETGAAVQYATEKLPDASILWSPRLGFNWDVLGNRSTQVRGGTGIFTGRPAYVWISNQIGNNGVITGSQFLDGTTSNPLYTRPFNPNTEAYKPATVTGAPAASYALALTDKDFKFPQVWRTSIGVDQRLPFGWAGTVEFVYNRDVNGLYYINANLPAAQTTFAGADNRPRWTSNRIYSNISTAVVLKNQDVGRAWNISGTLEKNFGKGAWFKAGYRYAEAKNTVDPGSIAASSFAGNFHSGDPNNPGLSYSASSPGHRIFATASYRLEYFNFGATSFSVFWEGYTNGTTSYYYSGDMNGDASTNDLIYVPRDASEMNFRQYTTGGVTFTPAQQAAAWDAYINQDSYLKGIRGQHSVRNAVFLPMVYKTDLSVSQDLFANALGKRHTLQFRADILNALNLLNKDWGVGQRLINIQPLTYVGAETDGRPAFNFRAINGALMSKSLEDTAGLGDVYRVQFSLRYTF